MCSTCFSIGKMDEWALSQVFSKQLKEYRRCTKKWTKVWARRSPKNLERSGWRNLRKPQQQEEYRVDQAGLFASSPNAFQPHRDRSLDRRNLPRILVAGIEFVELFYSAQCLIAHE
jgi:hypothetical protein